MRQINKRNLNQISYHIYMERLRKNEELAKMAKALNLKNHPQVKTKENVAVGVSNFTGKEGNSHEDGKANICWASIDNGTQSRILTAFTGFLPVHTRGSHHSYLRWHLPSWSRSFLHSFMQLGRRSKVLPESFGPWLFSAKIIHTPKRYILGLKT